MVQWYEGGGGERRVFTQAGLLFRDTDVPLLLEKGRRKEHGLPRVWACFR